MALHDKKPIELENGWRYMEVRPACPTGLVSDGPCQGLPDLPSPLSYAQDGITKLKRILEGDNTEVGGGGGNLGAAAAAAAAAAAVQLQPVLQL